MRNRKKHKPSDGAGWLLAALLVPFLVLGVIRFFSWDVEAHEEVSSIPDEIMDMCMPEKYDVRIHCVGNLLTIYQTAYELNRAESKHWKGAGSKDAHRRAMEVVKFFADSQCGKD